MTDSTNPDIQSAVPKRGRPRGVRLDGLSPVQREQVARWLDWQARSLPAVLAREEHWLAGHPDDKNAIGNVWFYRAKLAALRQLAYFARTQRGARPLTE